MPTHDSIFAILPLLFESSYLLFCLLILTILLLAIWGKALPTRKTFWLMGAPLPFILLGTYWHPVLAGCQIYDFGLIFALLIDRFLMSIPPRDIEVRRNFPEKFSIGEANEVLLTLVNNSAQAIMTEWNEDTPDTLSFVREKGKANQVALTPYETKILSYSVVAKQRGLYRFGYTALRYRSRFHLLWITKRGSRPEKVRVYPNLRELQKLRARYSKSLMLGELRKRALGQEGTQFSGLRNYYTGDDIRGMDWKATARLDSPVVRAYAPEVNQPVLILLEAGWKMQVPVEGLEKFDWALNAGLSLANVALDRGDQAAFGVFSNDVTLMTGFGHGRKHRQLILESVYDVQPQSVEPDYNRAFYQIGRLLRKRCFVVLFTDLVDPAVSQTLIEGLSAFSGHHLILVVTFRDTELDMLRESVPKTIPAAFQRGVAEDMASTREAALSQLTRDRNILLMDVPPSAMSSSLIQHYLTIKRKNRI